MLAALSERVEDRSVISIPTEEDESLVAVKTQENLHRNLDIEVTLAPQDRFREWLALMIHSHRHLLHSFRHDAITDGGLCLEEGLGFLMLVRSVEENDVLDVRVFLEEGEELASIDRPSILALRVEDVCPVDENECLAFECEERSGDVRCILPQTPMRRNPIYRATTYRHRNTTEYTQRFPAAGSANGDGWQQRQYFSAVTLVPTSVEYPYA